MDTRSCFTLFQALPTELRFKIWECALCNHVIVDFIPKKYTEFHVAVRELHSVRPLLSIDHSYTARACKEAWHVMKGPFRRIEFAAGSAESPYYYGDWLDFSRTTFFLGHGGFGSYCVDALTPEHISVHVKSMAMAWFTYRDLVMTCRRLIAFPALQRIVLLIPLRQEPRTPPPFHDTVAALDLYLQGRISKAEDPFLLASHTREEVGKSLQYQYSELGRKCPTVEAVLIPGSL